MRAAQCPDLLDFSRGAGSMRRKLLETTRREGALEQTGTMRVAVDPDRCQGHNRCQALAPELFEADDHGFARARGTGAVPPGLQAKALLAVRNCPEYAVRVVREST